MADSFGWSGEYMGPGALGQCSRVRNNRLLSLQPTQSSLPIARPCRTLPCWRESLGYSTEVPPSLLLEVILKNQAYLTRVQVKKMFFLLFILILGLDWS